MQRDLSAPEILMLFYADTFHTGNNVFQQFWKYRYEVDPDSILNKLLRLKYIEIGSSESALNRKTVQELKAFLKKHQLPVTGKKQDLIYRILNNVDSVVLEPFCTPKNYQLTDKGKQIVNNNPNVLYAHRHINYNFNEREIFDYAIDIREIAKRKFLIQVKSNVKKNHWGLVRNDFYTLADISAELELYNDALKFLVLGICIDVSGIDSKYAIENGLAQPGEDYCCTIYPFSIERISQTMDLVSMSTSDFATRCSILIEQLHLPYSYYDKDTIKDMIISELVEYRGENDAYFIEVK